MFNFHMSYSRITLEAAALEHFPCSRKQQNTAADYTAVRSPALHSPALSFVCTERGSSGVAPGKGADTGVSK